jgi:four helix bundle protein
LNVELKKENIIQVKSFQFALSIIQIYRQLQHEKEFVISNQLLRSGTSIGANVMEAEAAISSKDFIHKMSIASKEARETKYWLLLLKEGKLSETNFDNALSAIDELIKILTSIVKSSQKNLN